MIIEAGKYYETLDGRKVGPMVKFWDNEFSADGGQRIYLPDGRRIFKPHSHEDNLISLWSEAPTSPVREVTKREIVPGVYGRVVVEYSERSPNLVGVMMNGAFIGATELRAAAAVLLELAGALDA